MKLSGGLVRMVVAAFLVAGPAAGVLADPAALLEGYLTAARKADPGFKGFDAARGAAFHLALHPDPDGGGIACATCHSKDPKGAGKSKVGKRIEPLAPAANPKRLTDAAKVEKWFKRNCRDVLQRECTAAEKGDFITWLAGIP